MNCKFFATRWGSEALTWEEFANKVMAAGFDGFEWGIQASTEEREMDEVWEMADRSNLLIIPQHWDTVAADFSLHKAVYAAWLEKIRPYPAMKINSQTGKDFFTFEQNSELIGLASDFTTRSGIPVYHETHRGKFSFAAHITKSFLEQIPSLQIALDISHWVNVAESFLEDQEEAVALAIGRTGHVHARVGYPEGPQVPDPRVREWQDALDRHIAWWDRIAARVNGEGPNAVLTITPEFGPYPYMVHVPHTGEPVSDQWAVNVFMMDQLKKRFL